MRSVVYPGTFDPITNGHSDLIQRASSLFDRVVVAVAEDTGKDPAFDTERRVELAEFVLRDIPQVEVRRFSGLLVHFAREHGRQEDAVVVPVRLGPEHGDVVKIGRPLDQMLDRAHSRHAVADHDERRARGA